MAFSRCFPYGQSCWWSQEGDEPSTKDDNKTQGRPVANSSTRFLLFLSFFLFDPFLSFWFFSFILLFFLFGWSECWCDIKRPDFVRSDDTNQLVCFEPTTLRYRTSHFQTRLQTDTLTETETETEIKRHERQQDEITFAPFYRKEKGEKESAKVNKPSHLISWVDADFWFWFRCLFLFFFEWWPVGLNSW